MEHDAAWRTEVIIAFSVVYIMRGSTNTSYRTI